MMRGRAGKRLREAQRTSEEVYYAQYSCFFRIQNTRLESTAYRIRVLLYFVSGRVPIIIKSRRPSPGGVE